MAVAEGLAKTQRGSAFLSSPRKMLINGEWVDAASGKTFPVYNPATGEEMIQVAEGDKEDINRAVAAARKAFEEGPWSKTTPNVRGKMLWKLSELIAENADTFAELESLDNASRLPVITAQTCLAGQFGFPGVDGIGELLLLRPDRGAVAVWSASGLSINDQAILLGDGFYRSVFESGNRVIGDTILEAQRRYAEDEGDEYLLDIYNLIGDPATIMN